MKGLNTGAVVPTTGQSRVSTGSKNIFASTSFHQVGLRNPSVFLPVEKKLGIKEHIFIK